MCGISGIFNISKFKPVELGTLERMIVAAKHRGPDGYGFFRSDQAGFAHARLSIIDLENGWQPIHNEDKSLWVILNGEIFNYRELRIDLERKGHKFYTQSDTEVIVHLYEEKGDAFLDELNGQFAIAIYNTLKQELFLARDRMGIRPLFYTTHNGRFYFSSEIKSIFAADRSIPRNINRTTLSDIFTFWMPGGNETIFEEVSQLPPGHFARLTRDGDFTVSEYWDIPFLSDENCYQSLPEEHYSSKLKELLIEAVRIRLRADVPVGAYLSGGLDSSAITTLIHHYTDTPLKTFSVSFEDTVYDESKEQSAIVKQLDTQHQSVECTYDKIARYFPHIIWHTETPILRTAPTPLYLLSKLVKQNDYKVVLTGEGADEILGGYDIFKEAKIRAFIKNDTQSSVRPYLLKRLYPYLALSPTKSSEYARKFFNTDADFNTDIFYGHRPRWATTERTKIFLTENGMDNNNVDPYERITKRFMPKIKGIDFFSRTQYVESKLLLANYLLSSQGDRMAMANSIEGRYPFLDHKVVEFACTIPPKMRMKVLNEKNILKKAMSGLLPKNILSRKKQPYMSPDIPSFFHNQAPEYIDHYLSDQLLREAGLFKTEGVSKLIAKCKKGNRQGFRENMAFVGILSTQILYEKFVKNFPSHMPAKLSNVKVMNN